MRRAALLRRAGPLPAVGVLSAAVGALVLQAWWARRGFRRLPEVTYVVDATVVPAGSTVGARDRPSLQVVAFGDSAVAGMGAPVATESLPAQVAGRLAEATGRPIAIRGHGVSGARTRDVLSQVAGSALDGETTLILVVVGTNDVLRLRAPRRFYRDSLELYRAVRLRTAAPVVVCSLPELRAVQVLPRPLVDLAAAYAAVLDRRQRAAAGRVPGVRWVDARRLVGPTFRTDPTALAGDRFHPSPFGYALMAEVLAGAALSVLPEGIAGNRAPKPR